jgi:hypothetical protein
MESDCESVDSGLEESAHSTLGLEPGSIGEADESIYENAAVLKRSTNAYLTPVTATIEKYQFGEQEEEEDEEEEEEVEEEEEELEEEVEDEVEESGVEEVEESGRGRALWGVRAGGTEYLGGQAGGRSSNPTEDKIAKEIRELKEREEELVQRRGRKSPGPVTEPSPPAAKEPVKELAKEAAKEAGNEATKKPR